MFDNSQVNISKKGKGHLAFKGIMRNYYTPKHIIPKQAFSSDELVHSTTATSGSFLEDMIYGLPLYKFPNAIKSPLITIQLLESIASDKTIRLLKKPTDKQLIALKKMVQPSCKERLDGYHTENWWSTLLHIQMMHGHIWLADILKTIGIDACQTAGRKMILFNPELIRKVDAINFIKGSERFFNKPIPTDSTLTFPINNDQLENLFQIGAENLCGYGSLSVHKCIGPKYNLYIKQARSKEATIEEFIALRVLKTLDANVPECAIINRNGQPFILTQACSGQDLPLNISSPLAKYRFERNIETANLFFFLLQHKDYKTEGNLIHHHGRIFLIDLGDTLRFDSFGKQRDFTALKDNSENDFLYSCQNISLKDMKAVITKTETKFPELQKTITIATKEIKQQNLYSNMHSQTQLQREVIDVIKNRLFLIKKYVDDQLKLRKQIKNDFVQKNTMRPDRTALTTSPYRCIVNGL